MRDVKYKSVLKQYTTGKLSIGDSWGTIKGGFKSPGTNSDKHRIGDIQFTGLIDKNGTEIYEGDKVRFIAIVDARKSHKTESTGVIEWDDEDAGFYILNDSDKFPHVKFWYAEEIEVIGNIYEL